MAVKKDFLELEQVCLLRSDGQPLLGPLTLSLNTPGSVGLYDFSFTAAHELLRWFIGSQKGLSGIERKGTLRIQGEASEEVRPLQCAYVSPFVISELSGYSESASDELAVSLELNGISLETIDAAVQWYLNLFDLNKVGEVPIEWLSGGQKQRLTIASSLIMNPRRLALLFVLSELDPAFRDYLIKYVNAYARLMSAVGMISLSSGELEAGSFDAHTLLSKREDGTKNEPSPGDFSPNEGEMPTLGVRLESFTYPGVTQATVTPITFELRSGDLLFLRGPNGVGKTTLAKVLTASTPHWKRYVGSITVLGSELRNLRASDVWGKIGYAPQDPTDYFASSSVETELAAFRPSTKNDLERQLLRVFNLDCRLAENPFDLDPVERKKLSIVISGCCAPRVLILDEPTQFQSYRDLHETLAAITILRNAGTAILCITHDDRLVEASSFAATIDMVYATGHTTPDKRTVEPLEANAGLSTRLCTYLNSAAQHLDSHVIQSLIRSDWEDQFPAWSKAFLNVLDNWSRKVYPAVDASLASVIDEKSANTGVCTYVDFGCGNGWQTVYTKRYLEERGVTVHALGLDISRPSVSCARALFRDIKSARFAFADCANEEEVVSAMHGNLGTSADLITCYFVLHDTCELKRLVRSISKNISDGGTIIFSLINPKWIDKLMAEGEMSPIRWRIDNSAVATICSSAWVGEFRIPDAYGSAALVPYFHRSLSSYDDVLRSFGLHMCSVHWVDRGSVKSLTSQNAAPLARWPEHVPQAIQSVIITCRKVSA